MEKYSRNCPKCKIEIFYTNKKNRNRAEKKEKKCKKCVYEIRNEKNRILIDKYLTIDEEINKKIIKIFESDKNKKRFIHNVNIFLKEFGPKESKIRICPSCEEKITHTTIYGKKQSEGKPCSDCTRKIFGKKHIGKNNPFYGKKHSKETIKHLTENWHISEGRQKHLENIKTDDYKNHMKDMLSGKNNPVFGLGGLHNIWIKKLGKIEGDKRFEEWKSLQSSKSKGEKNHMFGKPSPKGSGNGWSGWYNGWYFRSINELSYMIKEIESKKLLWENGEQKKYCIPYIDWEGINRNYFPDFIVDNKYMIECKPKKLHASMNVILKKEAAEIFCKHNNLQYILTEPEKITIEEMKKMYIEKKIKFIEKYEKKFIEKYLKPNSF